MSVYFLRPIGFYGPIKIGHSMSTAARRKELENWSPFPLEILAEEEQAGGGLENRLHAFFAADRLHFEWFEPSPKLLSLIASMRRGLSLREAMELEGVPALAPYESWFEARRLSRLPAKAERLA